MEKNALLPESICLPSRREVLGVDLFCKDPYYKISNDNSSFLAPKVKPSESGGVESEMKSEKYRNINVI